MIASREQAATTARPAPAAKPTFISLVETLQARALNTPDKLALTFIQDSNGSKTRLTYEQLFLQAAALAARLQQRQLQNCRVLLVLRSNPLFVIAFFACLLAGATAVPSPVPRRDQLQKRLNDLTIDSGALAMLGDSDDVLQSSCGSADRTLLAFDLRDIDLEEPDRVSAHAWKAPRLTADSLAFLQYTSGSTSSPKGVMVSHGNLTANLKLIQAGVELTEKTRQFVALPLFHDMGLTFGALLPIYAGNSAYLMSPALFASAPQLWLQTISRYQIAISGGPNFMFELALEAIQPEHLEHVDLSCWRTAFCGAEPIKHATIEAFVERFAKVGFDRAAFYPCYGMAEMTVFATGHERGTPHAIAERRYEDATRRVYGCGKVGLGHDAIIVDPVTCRRVDDDIDGEIWLSGPSVARGYWQKPEATESTFNAWTDDTHQGPFLRTGDLGFMRGGELFVTGRRFAAHIAYSTA